MEPHRDLFAIGDCLYPQSTVIYHICAPAPRAIDELVRADGDWTRIDEICVTDDWSARDAISIALTRDRELAEQMLIDPKLHRLPLSV